MKANNQFLQVQFTGWMTIRLRKRVDITKVVTISFHGVFIGCWKSWDHLEHKY